MRASGDEELKIYGIFGSPLGHTVSPAIQNRAFDHYHLKSIYFAFERSNAQFRSLMRHLKSLLLDGFNVTVPFKEIVLPYLDRLSPEARAIGAVNTVKREGRNWTGYNTDGAGFLAGLGRMRFNARGKTAVILGAGGSARAVACALAQKRVRRLVFANRTENRAKALVHRFQNLFPKVTWSSVALREPALISVLSEADLLVNATQVGLKKTDSSLVSPRAFPGRRILVYDLIYRPRVTRLIQIARKKGHRTLNGEEMLLHQGAKAFEIWTGRKAPVAEMRKALYGAIAHP